MKEEENLRLIVLGAHACSWIVVLLTFVAAVTRFWVTARRRCLLFGEEWVVVRYRYASAASSLFFPHFTAAGGLIWKRPNRKNFFLCPNSQWKKAPMKGNLGGLGKKRL